MNENLKWLGILKPCLWHFRLAAGPFSILENNLSCLKTNRFAQNKQMFVNTSSIK